MDPRRDHAGARPCDPRGACRLRAVGGGRADAVVGVSRWVADTLAGAGNDPARIHVVLNAIDAGAWEVGASRSEARQALGLPLDAPVVLSVCRLFPSKGPGDLIQAMAVVTR